MSDDFEDFARRCKDASRSLRRLPRDLKKELASEVKTEVAAPLAKKISAAASGPYGSRLSGQVKVRAAADPTIVVGGTKRLVSGGASGRQLVFGTEFGGGNRVTAVPARNGHKGYKRHTTRQFRKKRPFVFPTIGKNGGWVLDRFADIVDKVIGDFNNGR